MDVNDRKECQAKVLNTMRLSLAFEVKYSVFKETSPLAIWSKLKKIYPSKSLTNRLYLKKQLYDLQIDDGSNIRGGILKVTKGVMVVMKGQKLWNLYRMHEEHSKLDAKSRMFIFLGHEDGVKGYRLWDIVAKKRIVSYKVVFDKSSMMIKQNANNLEVVQNFVSSNGDSSCYKEALHGQDRERFQKKKVNENPGKEHWNALKWIFRYLTSTVDSGIMFD
ncbi:hypothetical protein RJ639_022910 [Escallonia herrerae]|uniref:Retroviral polymerase SH3-like domain-containing protein n=1 Tax=Escallonia herrerae TaxID=1293975 RepID=A0AA88V3E7_9ASTE|nr:hypothetical protein RJ639_022910 [Escallonia herrerae]